MSKSVILALAAAASALANAAVAVASQYEGTEGTSDKAPEETNEATKGGRRGRPAAAEKPAAEEETKSKSGKTFEDMKALIEPLVKGDQGPEVKKAIAKYTPGKLSDMDPKHYPAFEKDIEALTY